MSPTDRRSRPDRRVTAERRARADAAGKERSPKDRRTGVERRGRETVEEHLRNALQLLSNIAETGSLDDEARRDLDAAMFRLRFAVDRLHHGGT